MSESRISSALVASYLEADLYPAAKTEMEGRTFTPVTGQAWAAITDLPSGNEPAAFGGVNPTERTGYMQIDFNHPAGKGTGPAMVDVDKAMAFYKPGRIFEYQGQRLKVRKAQRSPIRIEAPWLTISVLVYYTAWVFPTA